MQNQENTRPDLPPSTPAGTDKYMEHYSKHLEKLIRAARSATDPIDDIEFHTTLNTVTNARELATALENYAFDTEDVVLVALFALEDQEV